MAGQHRNNMDVISGMPDGDPADRVILVAVAREAGAVHNVVRDLRPLVIRQDPVARSGPDRAVPHRSFEAAGAERGLRLVQ